MSAPGAGWLAFEGRIGTSNQSTHGETAMRLILTLTAVTLFPVAGLGHHSTGGFYETGTMIEVTGTVTEVFWRNPHVGLTLEVANDAGETELWEIEGGAWNTVQRRGVTSETVAIGDEIRVAGRPATRGVKAVWTSHIRISSGEEFVLSDRPSPPRWTEASSAPSIVSPGAATAAAEAANGIFRVWSSVRGFGGTIEPPALTAEAQALKDQWDQAVDDPGLRCEAPGMPNAILNPYPIQFIDEGDHIRLLIEEWDGNRVIYMDPATTPADPPVHHLGHSVGSWEGNTLVVEIDRVSAPYLDAQGTPMSDAVTMVERFTLSDDETGLEYEVTVTDPVYLTAPAVWQRSYAWIPGVEVKPFDCTLRETGRSVYEN